ncbi:signal peptidase I [bacterium]|nr:signal peptidase I [bacterium]
MLNSFRALSFALFLALVFRFSVASPYRIPTGSMIPSLKIGDFLFVSKLSYAVKVPFTNNNLIQLSAPKRGDVIVFPFPDDPTVDYIKRVVGIGGDIIEINDKQLYVNGEPIAKTEFDSQKYLYDHRFIADPTDYHLYKEDLFGVEHIIMERSNTIPEQNYFGPYKVPDNHVFVIGDNRDNSLDGRYWQNQAIPVKSIRGKAMFVWLSLDNKNPLFYLGNIAVPSIRSHRFGMTIK